MGDAPLLSLGVVEDDYHHAQYLSKLGAGQLVQNGHGDAHLGKLGHDLGQLVVSEYTGASS